MKRSNICPLCINKKNETKTFLKKNINHQIIGEFSYSSRKVPEFMNYELLKCDVCTFIYAINIPNLERVNNDYKNPLYTRKDWRKNFSFWQNVRELPALPYNGDKRIDDPFQWGSGGHALNLACTFNPNFVVMIGFDLYSSDKLFNNIYKDTENYNAKTKHATDPSYWIYQTAKLFELYPNIKFLQIQPDDWEPPEEWDQYDNFFIDNYENFKILVDKHK